jgi:hypothetical protein
MEVKKKTFDQLKACLEPSGANPEQSEIIEAIYGDELRWAGDVYGFFICTVGVHGNGSAKTYLEKIDPKIVRPNG